MSRTLPSSRRAFILCRLPHILAAAMLAVFSCCFYASPAPSPAASRKSPSLPQISLSIARGQFISAVGRRAALLGNPEGQFEAWVYPLKILRGLHLRFHFDGRILPAEPLARSVIARPESSTIVYSDGSFQVRETLFVPIHNPGAIITFDIRTERPLEVEVAFTPDLQLEWPANLGPSHFSWDSDKGALLLAAEDLPYAALVGSPTARDPKFESQSADARHDSAAPEASFLLGVTQRNTEKKLLCIAASLQGLDDTANIYDRLLRGANVLLDEATNYYHGYLRGTLNIELPDPEIQHAYDWARISLAQAIVDNPLVGTSLVAGYGPSTETQRPGFDWFFGRDALWSSLALDSEGDFADAKAALEFLARYQRPDGKIPHEVPQSATLVRWFEDYPYGYASADATPLFLIAACDYVERSGDLSYARQKWDSISRAYQFLNSTLDADGFAQNLSVGHGWVESGPLVPVRTEIYQAALGVEALRAMAALDRLLGKNDQAANLDETFRQQRSRLNALFWSPENRSFAFALDANSRRVDELTVLPAVPLWFGLLDPIKAKEMIERLAAPDMQTDWGVRLLSSSSAKYAGDGYHFGAVWPLFTGWAAVGEYRYHRALAAYANLRSNSLLALNGSVGHVTEVLSGDYYEPLPTSTPQQTWSAAMIVSPLVEGLLGLQTDATTGEVGLAPHVPADWDSFGIANLRAGSTTLTLRFRKVARGLSLEVTRAGKGKCTLDFSPALSLRARVRAATLNGLPIPFRIDPNDADQHVSVRFDVPAGRSTLRIGIDDDFELSITSQLPPRGDASRGLRLLSRSWTPEHDRLKLEVSGLPGNDYQFSLSNAGQIASVEGAELDNSNRRAPKLTVRFPPGSDRYVKRGITLRFKAGSPGGNSLGQN